MDAFRSVHNEAFPSGSVHHLTPNKATAASNVDVPSPVFRVRLIEIDHYQSQQPDPQLDPCVSPFTDLPCESVPVLRVFGTTPAAQHCCLHVHGAMPYLYVDLPRSVAREDAEQYTVRLGVSLDKALLQIDEAQWKQKQQQQQSSSSNRDAAHQSTSNTNQKGTTERAFRARQHLHSLSLVYCRPIYGYHSTAQAHIRIACYAPSTIRSIASVLASGCLMQRQVFQPCESHIEYALQFMCDHGLLGMDFVDCRSIVLRRPLPERIYTRLDPGRTFVSPRIVHATTEWSQQADAMSQSQSQTPTVYPNALSMPLAERIFVASNTDAHLLASLRLTKSSYCELEGDISIQHIMNSNHQSSSATVQRDFSRADLQAASTDLVTQQKLVKSLATLWDNERNRRLQLLKQKRADAIAVAAAAGTQTLSQAEAHAALVRDSQLEISQMTRAASPERPSRIVGEVEQVLMQHARAMALEERGQFRDDAMQSQSHQQQQQQSQHTTPAATQQQRSTISAGNTQMSNAVDESLSFAFSPLTQVQQLTQTQTQHHTMLTQQKQQQRERRMQHSQFTTTIETPISIRSLTQQPLQLTQSVAVSQYEPTQRIESVTCLDSELSIDRDALLASQLFLERDDEKQTELHRNQQSPAARRDELYDEDENDAEAEEETDSVGAPALDVSRDAQNLNDLKSLLGDDELQDTTAIKHESQIQAEPQNAVNEPSAESPPQSQPRIESHSNAASQAAAAATTEDDGLSQFEASQVAHRIAAEHQRQLVEQQHKLQQQQLRQQLAEQERQRRLALQRQFEDQKREAAERHAQQIEAKRLAEAAQVAARRAAVERAAALDAHRLAAAQQKRDELQRLAQVEAATKQRQELLARQQAEAATAKAAIQLVKQFAERKQERRRARHKEQEKASNSNEHRSSHSHDRSTAGTAIGVDDIEESSAISSSDSIVEESHPTSHRPGSSRAKHRSSTSAACSPPAPLALRSPARNSKRRDSKRASSLVGTNTAATVSQQLTKSANKSRFNPLRLVSVKSKRTSSSSRHRSSSRRHSIVSHSHKSSSHQTKRDSLSDSISDDVSPQVGASAHTNRRVHFDPMPPSIASAGAVVPVSAAQLFALPQSQHQHQAQPITEFDRLIAAMPEDEFQLQISPEKSLIHAPTKDSTPIAHHDIVLLRQQQQSQQPQQPPTEYSQQATQPFVAPLLTPPTIKSVCSDEDGKQSVFDSASVRVEQAQSQSASRRNADTSTAAHQEIDQTALAVVPDTDEMNDSDQERAELKLLLEAEANRQERAEIERLVTEAAAVQRQRDQEQQTHSKPVADSVSVDVEMTTHQSHAQQQPQPSSVEQEPTPQTSVDMELHLSSSGSPAVSAAFEPPVASPAGAMPLDVSPIESENQVGATAAIVSQSSVFPLPQTSPASINTSLAAQAPGSTQSATLKPVDSSPPVVVSDAPPFDPIAPLRWHKVHCTRGYVHVLQSRAPTPQELQSTLESLRLPPVLQQQPFFSRLEDYHTHLAPSNTSQRAVAQYASVYASNDENLKSVARSLVRPPHDALEYLTEWRSKLTTDPPVTDEEHAVFHDPSEIRASEADDANSGETFSESSVMPLRHACGRFMFATRPKHFCFVLEFDLLPPDPMRIAVKHRMYDWIKRYTVASSLPDGTQLNARDPTQMSLLSSPAGPQPNEMTDSHSANDVFDLVSSASSSDANSDDDEFQPDKQHNAQRQQQQQDTDPSTDDAVLRPASPKHDEYFSTGVSYFLHDKSKQQKTNAQRRRASRTARPSLTAATSGTQAAEVASTGQCTPALTQATNALEQTQIIPERRDTTRCILFSPPTQAKQAPQPTQVANVTAPPHEMVAPETRPMNRAAKLAPKPQQPPAANSGMSINSRGQMVYESHNTSTPAARSPQQFTEQLLHSSNTQQLSATMPTPSRQLPHNKQSAVGMSKQASVDCAQYLTSICIETHAMSRGTLCPDPRCDAVGAIVYTVRCDIHGESTNDASSDSQHDVTGVLLSTALHSSTSATTASSSEFTPRLALPQHVTLQLFPSETSLLQAFILLIRSVDPDLLIGYECQHSSLGYLAERCAYLNDVDLCSELSRMRSFESIRNPDADIFNKKQGNNNAPPADAAAAGASNKQHKPFSSAQTTSDNAAERYQFNHGSGMHCSGRIVLNVWRIMRDEVKLCNYRFETLCAAVLNRRAPLVPHHIRHAWFLAGMQQQQQPAKHACASGSSLTRLLHYYLIRCRYTLALLDTLDLVGRTSELARVFGIKFYAVLDRGSQYRVESLMLRLCKLPQQSLMLTHLSPAQRATQPAMECLPLVMEPVSRFYTSPVMILDFASLYPSIMIAYNLCFSTCLGKLQPLTERDALHHDSEWSTLRLGGTSMTRRRTELHALLQHHDRVWCSPNGILFLTAAQQLGILPQLLREILDTRVMIKSTMKRSDVVLQPALHRLLNARQFGLKLIANVTYGYTAAGYSGRMPCAELADAIVQTARQTLERAIVQVESHPEWRAKVVYGDTDSLFVHLEGRTRTDAWRIGAEIARHVTLVNPKPVTLQLDKCYQPCILLAKKRYCGMMYESPTQIKPTYEAKGIESVRRDGCPLGVRYMDECIRLLFKYKDVSRIRQYMERTWSRMFANTIPLSEYIFAKESKLGTYRSMPASAIVATRLIERDPRLAPLYAERVAYVVVDGHSVGARLMDRVVPPLDVLAWPHLYRLDLIYYIEKVLLPPICRILDLLGVSGLQWWRLWHRPRRTGLVSRLAVLNDDVCDDSYIALDPLDSVLQRSNSNSRSMAPPTLPAVSNSLLAQASGAAAANLRLMTGRSSKNGTGGILMNPSTAQLFGKRTLEHYYASKQCRCCGEHATNHRSGVCDTCRTNLQSTLYRTMHQLQRLEREYDHAITVCKQCMQCDYSGALIQQPHIAAKQCGIVDIECTSLDCPNLFQRQATKHRLLEARIQLQAAEQIINKQTR